MLRITMSIKHVFQLVLRITFLPFETSIAVYFMCTCSVCMGTIILI